MSDQVEVPKVSRAYAAYALGLLTVINLLNYLDRNVIFSLFESLKRDLSLSDTQLGWLGSAYILVYSLAALPFGVLSDLRSRRAVIAWGVGIWSSFTALGGLVRSFGQLLVCRAAVGIGEAAFAPAATSLVSDYFPAKRRAGAMAILSSGLAFGGVLGIWVGGLLEQAYGWRVAFMAVGIPGFACALLAGRLVDPTRSHRPVRLSPWLIGSGIRQFVVQFHPILFGALIGLLLALLLQLRFGAGSDVDVAAFGICIGIGIVTQVVYWVRAVRHHHAERTPLGADADAAVLELREAVHRVAVTPTLVYVFLSGAMASFGMNGLIGWGPAFLGRALGLDAGAAGVLLGGTGVLAGVTGTLAGGAIADVWFRRSRRARVLTVAIGLVTGSMLSLALLTVRDLGLFRLLFAAAFFFFSWNSGPASAIIFDVVPARVGASVAGAYFLFIHLAGDAIAMPLVGFLSDQFGLERATYILPVASLLGGAVM
ncbi:MAG TPA: MFS transporter, partial [Gemmatimonadales bacterium]|nr:MFS transporter [Gemmatimonadales bacterium]